MTRLLRTLLAMLLRPKRRRPLVIPPQPRRWPDVANQQRSQDVFKRIHWEARR